MSKVICDICGTAYSEFEDFCPNCGCSQDVSADMDMELEEDNFLEDSPFTAARKQKEAAAAEEQEKLAAQHAMYVDLESEEEEEEETARGTGLAVVLTVLIMLLLGAAAFLFLRFILPNMELGKLPELTKPVAQEQTADDSQTEGIPCRMLVMTSGGILDLTREGEYKLIHVMVKPEDTTDILTYTSSDETIVTVTEEGRLTAISEGEATVTITCGDQNLVCRVNVVFTQDPEPVEEPKLPVETEEDPQELENMETEPEETQADETEPEETVPEASASQLKDVTLKLGKSEFILPPGYTYTVPLDCDLSYEEIEWSTENTGVATVKNGVVSGISYGVTTLTAKYGDQTATCLVRIKKI